MIQNLHILLSGFSVVAILILLIAYVFFLPDMRKSISGKLACTALLLCLAALQLSHYTYFQHGTNLLATRLYGTLLIGVPAAFFFFARVVVFPEVNYRWWDLLHLLPLVVSPILPMEILPATAFTLGTAYTCWFALLVLKLRGQHGRFKFERFFFIVFALMAMMALGLGLALPYLDHAIYYALYADAISIAVMMVLASLLFFPQLTGDLRDMTELAYAKSKLNGVDTESKIAELERLMALDRLFENEELTMATVAEHLQLSPHQLSELINTQFGHGYSRYVREHRIRAAKKMLIDEPTASILSVSMSTGFKSQSNFYTAFKEICDISPGEYRKTFDKA